jgi:hypothetical protein
VRFVPLPSVTTRRAFLLGSASALTVGAAGFWIGSRNTAAPPTPGPSAIPGGDAVDPRRARLHELVTRGTDRELLAEHALLLSSLYGRDGDEILLRGVGRLARIAVQGSDPKCRLVARSLLQLRAYPTVERELRDLLDDLRRVAK